MSKISREQLAELISGRRTVHKFIDRPAPREELLHAIEMAQWAPNHYLTEPWHFYLLDQGTVDAVIELNSEMMRDSGGEKAAAAKEKRWRKMPGWFVITSAVSEVPLKERENYAACCCAAQNLMLVLWNEGIGSKWSTGDLIRGERFYKLLSIDPGTESVVGLFWYGYAEKIPKAIRRKSAQIITELS